MPTYRGPDGRELFYDLIGPSGPSGAPSRERVDAPAAVQCTPAPVVVLPGGPAREPEYLGGLSGLLGRPLALVHLRGVGRSPAPTNASEGSAWGQADDVEALRRELGLDRAVVFAHSAAARMAVGWAVAHPDRMAGLCLVTPSVGFLVGAPTDTAQLIAERRADPVFDAAVRTLESPPPEDDAGFTAWQRAAAPAGYAHWGDTEQGHARTGRWSRSAAAAFLQPIPPGLTERLARVTAPVLVVAGAQDVFTGTAGPAAVAELFPAGRLAVIDDCGHYPWVEQPEAFRVAVDTFLTSIGA